MEASEQAAKQQSTTPANQDMSPKSIITQLDYDSLRFSAARSASLNRSLDAVRTRRNCSSCSRTLFSSSGDGIYAFAAPPVHIGVTISIWSRQQRLRLQERKRTSSSVMRSFLDAQWRCLYVLTLACNLRMLRIVYDHVS